MKSIICSRVIFLSTVFVTMTHAQYPQMDFPLQLGNRWQYSEVPGNFSESRVVRDTTMPNGLIYTQVQGELFSGFFRNDGAKVFGYSSSTNNEGMIYDFSKKQGDTLYLQVTGTDTVTKTVYQEGTRTIFGQQRHYMAFLTKLTKTSMYSIYYITDGFGFSGYNGELLSYGLAGAIVNGIQYGVVLAVHNSENAFPMRYQIFQNYPNPFNPITNISFNVPSKSFVSLKVFDLLGREVETMLSEELSSGSYTRQWNAENMPSGIYFYRLQSGSFTETKKLVLLR